MACVVAPWSLGCSVPGTHVPGQPRNSASFVLRRKRDCRLRHAYNQHGCRRTRPDMVPSEWRFSFARNGSRVMIVHFGLLICGFRVRAPGGPPQSRRYNPRGYLRSIPSVAFRRIVTACPVSAHESGCVYSIRRSCWTVSQVPRSSAGPEWRVSVRGRASPVGPLMLRAITANRGPSPSETSLRADPSSGRSWALMWVSLHRRL